MKRNILLLLLLSFTLMASPAGAQTKLSASELQKLVAPIALYPDPLLAQILPASTYPLEIVDAARIITSQSDFSKIDSQNWDPSVKAVAHYPSVLKMMNEKLSWTQQLGQAVLSQQQDVMAAIQTLRQEAQKAGNLKSTTQQNVQTTQDKIEILPANPQVVYVPYYDPAVVYTTPAVAYAAPIISFGAGFAMGAWMGGGFYWPSNTIVWHNGGYWGGYGGYGYHNVNVNNVNINNNNWNNYKWNHNDNYSNPYNGRTGSNSWNSSSSNSSLFSKNNSSLNTSEAQKANVQNFQKEMGQTQNRGQNSGQLANRGGDSNFADRSNARPQGGFDSDRSGGMFGNGGSGDRATADSMRGFDSRGGGGGGFGGYRGFGGGGGGGFGGGGGGFRGGGGRR